MKPRVSRPHALTLSPSDTVTLFAVLLLTTWVFAPVRTFSFLSWDDPVYVTQNPMVLKGLSWAGIAWAFTTNEAANWHPLTWLSHMLDVTLYGASPAAAGWHHVTSLVLHLVSAGALVAALRRMTGDTGASAVVGALFAIHPLHVESVAWISERKDVLSALFAWLTLWSYARDVQSPRARPSIATLALFACGLLAKPMLVTLPIVLLLLDRWPLARVWSIRLITEKIPFAVLALASSVVTFLVQRQGGAVGSLAQLAWDVRIKNAAIAYVAYLGKTIWPTNLSAFYPYPPTTSTGLAIGATAVLAICTWMALRFAKTRPSLLVGWLWYLVTLVPVIGLVQVGDQAMADRYTYLPLVGIFIAVVFTIPRAWRTQMAAVVAAAAIVLALAVTARAQVETWADNEHVWSHALAVTPDNYRAHIGLGDALMDRGDAAAAVEHYTQAAALVPRAAPVQNSLGLALTAAGRVREAAAAYLRATELDPSDADAHDNLGAMFARTGRIDEAIFQYREAIRLAPGLALAHNNLGLALAGRGEVDAGIREIQEAIRLKTNDAQWRYQLAVILDSRGRRAEAIDQLKAALTIDPAHQAARALLAQWK